MRPAQAGTMINPVGLVAMVLLFMLPPTTATSTPAPGAFDGSGSETIAVDGQDFVAQEKIDPIMSAVFRDRDAGAVAGFYDMHSIMTVYFFPGTSNPDPDSTLALRYTGVTEIGPFFGALLGFYARLANAPGVCREALMVTASEPGAAVPSAAFVYRCAETGVNIAFETMSFNATTGFIDQHAVFLYTYYDPMTDSEWQPPGGSSLGASTSFNMLSSFEAPLGSSPLDISNSYDMLTDYKAAVFGGESVRTSNVLQAYTDQSRIWLYDHEEGAVHEYAGEAGATAYFSQLRPRTHSVEVEIGLEHVDGRVVQLEWKSPECGYPSVAESLFLGDDGKVLQHYVFMLERFQLDRGCEPELALTAALTTPAASPGAAAAVGTGAACSGSTISFAVTGQPNVAVGFFEWTSAMQASLPIAMVSAADGSGTATTVSVVCSSGQLQVEEEGTQRVHSLATPYRWPAQERLGFFWTTTVELASIMYATKWDGEEALTGVIEVQVNNTFLETKLSWAPSSTMADLTGAIRAAKAAAGGCPMLSATHSRADDLGGGYINMMKAKQDYMHQYTTTEMKGTVDTASEDANTLAWVTRRQSRDDELLMSDGQLDVFLTRNQMTCFADTYDHLTVRPAGMIRAESYTYRGAHDMCYNKGNAPLNDQGLGVLRYTQRDVNRTGTRFRQRHLGLHGSGGAYPNAVDYSNNDFSDKEHDVFKSFLWDALPPNWNGAAAPELNSKFDRLEKMGALNISHVPEMILSLGHHWISGKPMLDHMVDLLARQAKCNLNLLENREYLGNSVPKGYKGDHEHCEGPDKPWAKVPLAAHYRGSPLMALVGQGFSDSFKTRMFSAEYWARTFQGQITFMVQSTEVMARKLLRNEEMAANFRETPHAVVRELLRLVGPPVSTAFEMTDTVEFNVSYRRRGVGDGGTRFPSDIDLEIAEMQAGPGNREIVPLYIANRDPAAFRKPNTFDPSRADWHKALTFGGPLHEFHTWSEGGGYTCDMTKAKLTDATFLCPGYYLAMEIMTTVVGKVLDSQASHYKMTRDQCVDNDAEIERAFGEAIYPEHSVCANAMARIDGRFELGVGCQKHAGLCCKTCAELAAGNYRAEAYVGLTRLLMVRTVWFPDQFSFTGPATNSYFLATQRYWGNSSVVEVTPTGKMNSYMGPEAILEYYSLQNQHFAPLSYREAITVHALTKHKFPKWDKVIDARRIHAWNMDPAITLGYENKGRGDLAPEYDFSQFVWDDEEQIYPVKRAFHDFRKPTLQAIKSGKPGSMLATFGDAADLCHLIIERCTGNYSQFSDLKACHEYMAKIPFTKPGYCPSLAGNTLACRFTHALLTHKNLRPEVHCFHMGPHKPDPDRKVKCHDDECALESQMAGPLECDGLTCDGKYAHAGLWVERLHVWVYAILTILGLMHGYNLRKRLKVFVKLIAQEQARLDDEGECEDLRSMLDHAKVAKDTTERLLPLCYAASFCMFWFFLVYMIALTAQPGYLWRPPPPEALLPRFNEIHSDSPDRQTSFSMADYNEQNSEHILSGLNSYQLQHLLYYVMLVGTFITIMTLEWIGFRMHSSATSHWIKSELSLLGDAIFVTFVTGALIYPDSSFSYVLFLIGTSKGLYPQILMTLWNAYTFAESHRLQAAHKEEHGSLHDVRMELMRSDRTTESGQAGLDKAMKRRRNTAVRRQSMAVPVHESDAAPLSSGSSIGKKKTFEEKFLEQDWHTEDEDLGLDVHGGEWSIGFVIHFGAGCGLMLHHLSMASAAMVALARCALLRCSLVHLLYSYDGWVCMFTLFSTTVFPLNPFPFTGPVVRRRVDAPLLHQRFSVFVHSPHVALSGPDPAHHFSNRSDRVVKGGLAARC